MCVSSSSPSVLYIFVDDDSHDECGQSVVPAHDEHDRQTEEGSEERGGPVVVAEPWAPVGGLQERLEGARKVDKHVTHEEKPVWRGERGENVCGCERERERMCVCVCVCVCV